MKVTLRPGESIQAAVRRFRKLTAGIIKEVRSRERYEKRNAKRKINRPS